MQQSNLSNNELNDISVELVRLLVYFHKQNQYIGHFHPINITVSQNKFFIQRKPINEDQLSLYRAPEAFHLLKNSLNEQTDLYSLGVLLYYLYSGQHPITPIDNQSWGEAHLQNAVKPIKDIHESLNQIILKLLQKDPADRYQHALGLQADIEQVLLGEADQVTFKIGRVDELLSTIERLQFPLQEHIELAVNRLLTVTVYPDHSTTFLGILGGQQSGKTETLKRIIDLAHKKHNLTYYVNCNDYNSHYHIHILKAMLEHYLRTIATYQTAKIDQIMKQIEQNELIDLDYIKISFTHFSTLLSRMLHMSHVEDAHLGSSANYFISEDAEINQLSLIIQALSNYTEQSVLWLLDNTESIPEEQLTILFSTVEAIKNNTSAVFTCMNRININKNADVKLLALNPLRYDEVKSVIVSIIKVDSEQVRLLAQAALYYSEGQVGKLRQLLLEWYHDQLLYFDIESYQWCWKDELIRNQHYTKDIIPFILEKVDGLQPEVKKIVAVASIMGERVHPLVLSDVCEESALVVREAMEQAEAIGIVFYDKKSAQQYEQSSDYVFLQDDVQRYLKRYLAQEETTWHYKIALTYYQKYRNVMSNSTKRFMSHFNLSASLLSEEGLNQLVYKNFELGVLFLEEQNFSESKYYLNAGHKLCSLYPEKFEDYRYKFMLYLAVVEYVSGNKDISQALFLALKPDVDKLDLIDKRKYYMWQMEIYALVDNQLSLTHGYEALKLYNWEISKHVSIASILIEIIKTQRMLKKYREGKLYTKDNTSEELKILSRIAFGISSAVAPINPLGTIHFYTRFIRAMLPEGMTEELAHIISMYEFMISRGAPDLYKLFPSNAFNFILDKEQYNSYEFYIIKGIMCQLHEPSEVYNYGSLALSHAVEMKDYRSLNMALVFIITTFNEDMYELEKLLYKINNNMNTLIDVKLKSLIEEFQSYYNAQQDEQLMDSYIYEAYTIDQEHINYISINRAEVSLATKDYNRVLFWCKLGEQSKLDVNWIQNRKLLLFKHLALSGMYFKTVDDEAKQRYDKQLKAFVKKMRKWEGFLGFESSVYYLIMAEYTSMQNTPIKAQSLYEKSIKLARDEKNKKIEALALERFSAFFDRLDSETGKMIALMDAIAAYTSVGMLSKVSDLKRQLLVEEDEALVAEEERLIESESSKETTTFPYNTMVASNDYQLHELYNLKGHWNNKSFYSSFLTLACRQVIADYGLVVKYDGVVHHPLACYSLDNQDATSLTVYTEAILNYCSHTLESYVSSQFVPQQHILSTAETAFKSILAIPIQAIHRNEIYILFVASQYFDQCFSEQAKLVLELLLSRFMYLAEQEHMSTKQVTSYLQTSVQTEAFSTLLEPLTEREIAVLKEIVNGLTNDEISKKLNIKVATVKTHINNTYSKLGVKRRAQAIIKAKEMNL